MRQDLQVQDWPATRPYLLGSSMYHAQVNRWVWLLEVRSVTAALVTFSEHNSSSLYILSVWDSGVYIPSISFSLSLSFMTRGFCASVEGNRGALSFGREICVLYLCYITVCSLFYAYHSIDFIPGYVILVMLTWYMMIHLHDTSSLSYMYMYIEYIFTSRLRQLRADFDP